MSSNIVFISEQKVRSLLDWDSTLKAVETSMRRVSDGRAFQNPRTFTPAKKTDTTLLTMPGYLEDDEYGAMACKLVTANVGNEKRIPSMPNILANIALFDEATGALKALVAGTEITTWRTAAASVVATKYLHDGKNKETLAILGAGVQGKSHALAFQHFFKFKEVRIWNHRAARGEKLVAELNRNSPKKEFTFCGTALECVKNADVVITVTSTTKPFLRKEWLKEGVHINAVGSGAGCHYCELESSVYESAYIYMDYWAGARAELTGLEQKGFKFQGEVGEVINGSLKKPSTDKTTVFQSLGMAVEDCAMARMIYDRCNSTL